jgi:hypothetical protein
MTINQMEDERGFTNFVRSAFGYYWVNAAQSAGGPQERVGGRIRSRQVQQALERADRAEARPKGN